MSKGKKKNLINGEPCDHSGCRAHVSHPCEGCGRIACRTVYVPNTVYHKTQWLRFRFFNYSQTRVTSIWEILSKDGKTYLGRIRWHAPWRCYVLFPEKDTLFNAGCMQDIIQFIIKLMKKKGY